MSKPLPSSLHLRNPHSVLAALASRPADVLEIHALRSSSTDAWKEVLDMAARQRVPVRQPVQKRERGQPREDGGRSGGTEAIIRPRTGVPLDQLFASTASQGVWLALDCLQDPHNVGAVFRTAAFFGIQGIIVTQDRSAPLSEVVYDVASGGLESVPFTLQVNLAQALEAAKKSDLWVLGSSEHAELDVEAVTRDRKWLLVIGNEEKGLRRLTLERCDSVCRITPRGDVTSLNVSVAAGILMAALTRPSAAP